MVRFGQQTNVCIDVQVVQDHVVAVTADGVIRVFSIPQKELIGQYKLSELPDWQEKLKNGIGGNITISWFKGQGRDMVVSLDQKGFCAHADLRWILSPVRSERSHYPLTLG